MISKKSKKVRVATIIGSIILSVGILFFLLRGPYLSNSIKRILIPVLENATQERIIIDKAVINLFPFYVQVKGFKLFDKDGNRLLWITKTRAYIDLLGLVSREIRIRKLTLKEPDLIAGGNDLQRIMENLKKSDLVGEEGKYRVSLKNIQLTDGNVVYISADKLSGITGSGLYLDMVPKGISSTITVLLKNGTLKLADQSELEGSFDGKIKIKNNRIEVAGINIYSSDSSFSADGEIFFSDEGKIEDGSLSVKAKIYASTINKIYSLKQKKDGELSLEGSVRLVRRDDSKWPGFDLDLKTDSRFYLETLMEIIQVDENITGELSVNGTIKGIYPDIVGEGDAKLKNAMLATLPLDDVEGELTYKDKKFALNGFKAQTYNGTIEGDGHIMIPSADYVADVHISDINSPQFFRYIEWEPPFPEGKISGDFKLNYENGHDIEVIADVNYSNTSHKEGNVWDRLSSAGAAVELRDNILWLKDSFLSADSTKLFLDGIIDLNKETLDLNLKLNSGDVSDLTAPYYTGVSAPVSFEGTAKGPASDPEIRGKAASESGSVHGIKFTKASADLIYRISSLSVDRLVINQDGAECNASGAIDFRKADGLFLFRAPYYKAKAELTNVNIRPFINVFYKEIPVSGRVSGKVSFEGHPDNFVSPGELSIVSGDIYGQQVDKVAVNYELRPKEIEFRSLKAYRSKSNLEAKGTLFFNKNFNISVLSEKIQLQDISAFNHFHYPVDIIFGLDLKGSGSIDNPELKFAATIDETLLKGVPAGKGAVTGTLKNKKLDAEGSLIDGLVKADAGVLFADRISWNVNSKFNKGRYDFLLAGFLKEVPEDFLVSLEGGVKLDGRGDKITVRSKFNYAALSLYGYDFINREDIDIEFNGKELRIKSFFLTGKDADLFAEGTVNIFNGYNMHLKGNMEIAPLRVLNDKITSLRGRGGFEVDITGPWKRPEVDGQVNISDATVSLSGVPYKIGPVNGTCFLKKERIAFDSISAKFAGGTIVMSGAGHLDGLSFKRFFMSADFNGIKIKPVEGLSAALDGRLFYENSSKGSSVTGNIDIKRARYTKRVEWKSWLFGLKEIDKKKAEYPEFLAKTLLNVHIKGTDNIIIDNNIARTPVKIALNLTGSVARRGLMGRIEAHEGTVYFRSNEFNILDGSSVDFVEPNRIAPVFHIIADTYISNYYVKLTLDGTMDKFTLSLFSDPPLSETDILALLTVGQTGKDVKGIESGIAAGEAAAVITGVIQDTVEEKFQFYTGVERFEIEPHTTTGGASVPKVTIGKRLFENKLFVTYSTPIGTSEESVVKLEYKIDKNISVVGSRNEIGSAGVDLKYKFEFK
ncbi:MAG: translocation/assembly module TamB domain-containing protein [Nitrospirae bacterium]|nr:translocation/assembly module TamB domain-containing protein [Nitrospirota bacterium]